MQAALSRFKTWRITQPKDFTREEASNSGDDRVERALAVEKIRGHVADFAITLIKADSFKVVYFHGDRDHYLPGCDLTTTTWLNEGRIFFSGDTLTVGVENSDEIFRFRWSDKAGRPLLLAADEKQ